MTTAPSTLETDLMALKQAAQTAIADAASLDDLEQLRISYLGKKGQLSKILGGWANYLRQSVLALGH
jgi:phenylalanyl-tRNA synthetase alpha chain